MANKIKPRKGMLLIGGGNAVLVTGPGNKNEGYDCFAGVVVMSKSMFDGDKPWPVGMYSETWSAGAFQKSGIKLSQLIYEKAHSLANKK